MKTNLYQDCWPPSFADGPVIGNEEPKIPLTTDEKIEVIKEEVSKFRRITFEEANIKSRKRELVMVRQEMMTLIYEVTPLSLKSIGRLFKKQFDHSSVLHAKDTIADLCFSDKQFKMQHELIRSKILSRI